MPGGRARFYFAGKEPFVVRVVALLLFANTFLMLALDFGRGYLVVTRLAGLVAWYSEHDLAIQFVLLAAGAAMFIVYRKRVHYERRE